MSSWIGHFINVIFIIIIINFRKEISYTLLVIFKILKRTMDSLCCVTHLLAITASKLAYLSLCLTVSSAMK